MSKITTKYLWKTEAMKQAAGGRPRVFNSPEEFWNAAVEYFDWAEANKLQEAKLVSFQGSSTIEKLPKVRAFTLTGLCNFLGISGRCWRDYRDRPETAHVAALIEQVIYQQKFEAAAADMLNVNIIARDLGLAERSELTGKDGQPLIPENREVAREVLAILAKKHES